MRTLKLIGLSFLISTLTILVCYWFINLFIAEINIFETILLSFLFGLGSKFHNFIVYQKRSKRS